MRVCTLGQTRKVLNARVKGFPRPPPHWSLWEAFDSPKKLSEVTGRTLALRQKMSLGKCSGQEVVRTSCSCS